MLLVAQTRDLDIRSVLSFPLGPVPWSLSTADGTLCKTSKSTLGNALRKSSPTVMNNVPEPSAVVVDGMHLLHKISGNNKTFEEIALQVFATATGALGSSRRIDLVLDVYKDKSIKGEEREARGSSLALEYKHINKGHKIKDWHKFLMSSKNKTALATFLHNEWKCQRYFDKLKGKEFYVTVAEECFRYHESGCDNVRRLYSNHEEADTRVFVHAQDASGEYDNVVLYAEDTDILVIGITLAKSLDCNLIQMTKSAGEVTYTNITSISDCLGDTLSVSLIGYHAFSGNDAISAFAGKGKLIGYNILKKKTEFQETFCQLGQTEHLNENLFNRLDKFVCKMYTSNTEVVDVNDCRYALFTARRGEIDSAHLPPCKDSLQQHSIRCNYLAGLWRSSLVHEMDIASPEQHGWEETSGQLKPKWMTRLPAPQAVLEMLSCDCRRSCGDSCQCRRNNLKCTPMCRLQQCDNSPVQEPIMYDIQDPGSDSEEI